MTFTRPDKPLLSSNLPASAEDLEGGGGDSYLYGTPEPNEAMSHTRFKVKFAFFSKLRMFVRDRASWVKWLAAASLLFIIWRLLRAFGPPGTGLENMPEYGVSLGCDDSKDYHGLIFTVGTIHPELAQHSLDLRGGVVGTVHILQGDSDAIDVKYEIRTYTDSKELGSQFAVKSPRPDDVLSGRDLSRVEVATPIDLDRSCMRYDMKLILPPRLRELHIRALSTTQIKMSPLAEVVLDKLVVNMYGTDVRNMLLVSKTFHANLSDFSLTRGWLVGSNQISNRTVISTHLGDAVTDLHIAPSPSAANGTGLAELQTTTGAGRTNIFYKRRPESGRPIRSTHNSWHRSGDIYLDYSQAKFQGKVNIAAKSFNAPGLKQKNGAGWMFVGDQDVDELIIASKGWVGLDLGTLSAS